MRRFSKIPRIGVEESFVKRNGRGIGFRGRGIGFRGRGIGFRGREIGFRGVF